MTWNSNFIKNTHMNIMLSTFSPSTVILNLSHLKLTSIPEEICRYTNLKELYIYSNYLESLPPELGKLTSLETLHVYHNKLKSLPSELGNLISLRYLDISYNHLVAIPPEICNLTSLKRLHLQGNKLTSIPPELGNLRSLVELNLCYNRISSLPLEIGALVHLKLLFVDSSIVQAPWQLAHHFQENDSYISYRTLLHQYHRENTYFCLLTNDLLPHLSRFLQYNPRILFL